MKSGTAIRDCRDVLELLTEYLEGDLAPASGAALEAHLALCDACAGFLESIRKTRDAVRGLASRDIPDACRRELRALLAAAKRAPARAASTKPRKAGGRTATRRVATSNRRKPRPARRRR